MRRQRAHKHGYVGRGKESALDAGIKVVFGIIVLLFWVWLINYAGK